MMAKKRKILAICNTPFQIVIASHILHTYYKDSEVDILVSDGIRGGEQLADNARKTNAFRRVLYIHNRKTFLTEKGWVVSLLSIFISLLSRCSNFLLYPNKASFKFSSIEAFKSFPSLSVKNLCFF